MDSTGTQNDAVRNLKVREHIQTDPIACPCDPSYEVNGDGILVILHQLFPEQYIGEN
jgi:hypothetical protein